MVFTEPSFLFLFLPALLALYFLKRPHASYANLLLLGASILFYAKGGGAFTWLMLASIAFNYWMAILVARNRSKRLVGAAVAVNLIVLGVFKYATFFAGTVNEMMLALEADPFAVPQVILPIGISFYRVRRVAVGVGGARRGRLAVLRRGRRDRGLSESRPADGRRRPRVAGDHRPLARLAARAPHRVRVHDCARQARRLPRARSLLHPCSRVAAADGPGLRCRGRYGRGG